MDLLIAGLAGVVVGATVAAAIVLYLVDRRADRDLIERRIRAFNELGDSLGNLERAFESAGTDPAVLEQAWRNVQAFCREFRLSGWILGPRARNALAKVAEELESAQKSFRLNGAGGARAAQLLSERSHEVQRIVRRELAAEQQACRAFRFLARRTRTDQE